MSEAFYPELPDSFVFALTVILENLAEDPEYLDFSPYSAEEIAVLGRFSALEEVEILENGDKWSRLERESGALFKALTDAGKDMTGSDHAQKMAYFRTATSLLDKIVGIQERVANLKQISTFYSSVIGVLEEVLDAGQRTDVLNKLKELTNADA